MNELEEWHSSNQEVLDLALERQRSALRSMLILGVLVSTTIIALLFVAVFSVYPAWGLANVGVLILSYYWMKWEYTQYDHWKETENECHRQAQNVAALTGSTAPGIRQMVVEE